MDAWRQELGDSHRRHRRPETCHHHSHHPDRIPSRVKRSLVSKKKVAAKAKPKPVIDPAEGPQMVLRGQIVTMDGTRRVLKDGLLYIDKGSIVAITATAELSHRALKV